MDGKLSDALYPGPYSRWGFKLGALIFDFDGVIADSEALANTVLAEFITDLGHATNLEDALEHYSGRRWDDAIAAIESAVGKPLPGSFSDNLKHKFGGNVFSADMVSRGKPHPDIFLLAADRLGVNPKSCLVIEDSTSGIKAAVAAGMTAVGLCAASHIREGHQLKLREAGAVHLANSWDEVA